MKVLESIEVPCTTVFGVYLVAFAGASPAGPALWGDNLAIGRAALGATDQDTTVYVPRSLTAKGRRVLGMVRGASLRRACLAAKYRGGRYYYAVRMVLALGTRMPGPI